MYDSITDTYSDEALVKSFVGKDVTVIHTAGVHSNISFDARFDGILGDNNGEGYYSVQLGDENLEGLGIATIRFNKGSVDAAWRAASGNIIRLHA